MIRRAVPLALLALALGYGWLATRIELDPWSAAQLLNARTLPIAYAVLLGALALAMTIRGVVQEGVTGSDGRRWLTLGLIAAAIVAFGVLIPYAGLWPATVVLLACSLLATGERRVWVVLAAPAGVALLGWLLIEVVLGVYIDPGTWFD